MWSENDMQQCVSFQYSVMQVNTYIPTKTIFRHFVHKTKSCKNYKQNLTKMSFTHVLELKRVCLFVFCRH